MDADRFDALAKALSARLRRRTLLMRWTGLGLGAVTALLAGSEAGEAQHPSRRLIKRNERQSQKAQKRRRKRREEKRKKKEEAAADPAPGAGGGSCVPLDQLCSVLGDSCCDPTACSPTTLGSFLVTVCQLPCTSTDECKQKLKTNAVECVSDEEICHNAPKEKCCRPKVCKTWDDCDGGPCCTTVGPRRCCAKGQQCAPGGGCKSG